MKGFTNTLIDPYTTYWGKKIEHFVYEYNIDVLHIHDLYMLGAAFRANKKLKKRLKIVADLHENYAAALKYYHFSNTFPGKYIISVTKWEKTEIEWIQKADHIITVIDEAKNRYINLGVPDKKITVVANYVHPKFFLTKHRDENTETKYENKFVLSYTGGFDTHRGLECVIKMLTIIREKIPNVMLLLIGQGRNKQELIKLSQKLKVADLISFEGWQPPNKMPFYCKASDICLIPHLKNRAYRQYDTS